MILGGAGAAFCAGHDLKELARRSEPQFYNKGLFSLAGRLMLTITDFSAPGDRPGARHRHRGRLPAGRHLRPRDRRDDARFATPGVNIGLFCTTPMVALSRAVGRKHAMQMLLTGDRSRTSGPRCRSASSTGSCRPRPDRGDIALAGLITAKPTRPCSRQTDLLPPNRQGPESRVRLRRARDDGQHAGADAEEGIDAFLQSASRLAGLLSKPRFAQLA